MASSRRTRRRREQQSLHRHQLRLEGLEKRYALNAAPVLDPSASPQLSSVIEDAGLPVGQVGTLVSELFSSDAGAVGIGITGTNLQGGTLYYSIDDGATWLDVGAVSDASPKVLYRDASTRLAFRPAADFHGTISDVVSVKSWDGLTTLTPISTLGSNFYSHSDDVAAFSADGNTLYAVKQSFEIFNITDPVNPVKISTLPRDILGSEWARDMTLSPDGNTAYVVMGSNLLHIIDVTNPVMPSLVSTIDGGWGSAANGIAISPDGNTACLGIFASGIYILDITDPTSPTLVATHGTFTDALGNHRSMSSVFDIALSPDGNTAFLADGIRGLHAIDVSSPESPFWLGTYDSPGTV